MAHALLALLSMIVPLVPVHVQPAVGTPRTTFVVSLRPPDSTGTAGTVHREDLVSVIGPQRPGCAASASWALAPGPAHRLVRVRLAPPALWQRWCVGTFRGLVTQNWSIACAPAHVCPYVVIAPQTIGRFRLRVSAPAGVRQRR